MGQGRSRILDGRGGNLSELYAGIHVSADVPQEMHGAMLNGDLDVASIRLRWIKGNKADVELPVRDFLPQELAMLLNQALQQGKLSVVFTPGPGTLPQPSFGPRMA